MTNLYNIWKYRTKDTLPLSQQHFITLQIDSREPVEFLSTTVSQAVIVLQQSSDHSTGQEFSHLAVVIRRNYVRVQQLPIITSDWLRKTEREIWSFIYLFTFYYHALPLGNHLSYFWSKRLLSRRMVWLEFSVQLGGLLSYISGDRHLSTGHSLHFITGQSYKMAFYPPRYST
jgi:hypothetical protein